MEIASAHEIVDFFDAYSQHFKELRMFITKKQDKVAGDDLTWLLDSLNEEQRLIMRGNSLEAKRLALFNSLGYKDYNSVMITDECPDEFKGKLRVFLDSINDDIYFIKNTNEDILDLIEKKLDTQAELINDPAVSGSNTYSNTGAKIHTSGDVGGEIIGKA